MVIVVVIRVMVDMRVLQNKKMFAKVIEIFKK
jgi:hypothetical protein